MAKYTPPAPPTSARVEFSTTIGRASGSTDESFKTWDCYLKSAPEVAPPTVKTNYIDLTDADGKLDITESPYGIVYYDNREIKIELVYVGTYARFMSMYKTIAAKVHGIRQYVWLCGNHDYAWYGRCRIDSAKYYKGHGEFVIICDAEPYRKAATTTTGTARVTLESELIIG